MSILDQIVREKRSEIGRLRPWTAALRARAETAEPARDFVGALAAGADVAVIGEVKRRSPSAGWIRRDLHAAGLASAYVHGGVAAISVLTDEDHFGGSREDLESVRAAVGVPVLRKDFIVDPVQVYEARAMGADAVLLIVRVLEDAALRDLLALAGELGMAPLVETHESRELERALAAGARVVGINNRDLTRFETDLGVGATLAGMVPRDVVLVGESGIRGPDDVDRMAMAGVDAVLVGEWLVASDDPVAAVRSLAGRRRGPGARPVPS